MVRKLGRKIFIYHGKVIWQLIPNTLNDFDRNFKVRSDKYGDMYVSINPNNKPKLLDVIICQSWEEWFSLLVEITKDNVLIV